jgi:hypothetical protein
MLTKSPLASASAAAACMLGLAAVRPATAAIAADEITSLPGWEGALPSKQYSGYLTVPGTQGLKHYHYWFVTSEGDPKTDPVALWLNGGPGSSSLIGFLTENGPFQLDDASLPPDAPNGTVPKLFHRETGWQKAASYIFLESPAGVGFSYCDYDNCTASDTSTAVDNHRVLKAFFAGFPEFAANDFYVTGESYAGVYCPTLAEQIMNDKENKINLVGLAVGNGCWGSKVGLCAFGADMARINAQFFVGHGAMSKHSYAAVVLACGDPTSGGPLGDGQGAWDKTFDTPKCQKAWHAASGAVGDFEIYNYYDTCYGTTGITMSVEQRAAHLDAIRAGAAFGAGVHSGLEPATLGGGLNDYSCGGGDMMEPWLARPDVVKALHVKAGTKGMAYGPRDRDDLRPLYKTLAAKYRLLIYSGDSDGCVPFEGTEEWTSGLGFAQTEAWRPWMAGTPQNASASVTAGYVTNYATGAGHNFTFITIKGAGHMVPEFKPVPALKMLKTFFAGEPF